MSMSTPKCLYCRERGLAPGYKILCVNCAQKIAASTWYAQLKKGKSNG
jgi:hypothetical protein